MFFLSTNTMIGHRSNNELERSSLPRPIGEIPRALRFGKQTISLPGFSNNPTFGACFKGDIFYK